MPVSHSPLGLPRDIPRMRKHGITAHQNFARTSVRSASSPSVRGAVSLSTLTTSLMSPRHLCANEEVHPVAYKYLTGSSLVVYIFHYALVQPFAYWVLRDWGFNEGVWKVLGPFVTFAFGLSGCLLIYAILLRVKVLGWIFGVKAS
mmetsp:Transcript_11301/g.16009  ORF Transcript_11301/g.16009 Transcript_11301/m.16009 type:complete len:146 (-) Transcript_11301:155-592(-)